MKGKGRKRNEARPRWSGVRDEAEGGEGRRLEGDSRDTKLVTEIARRRLERERGREQ